MLDNIIDKINSGSSTLSDITSSISLWIGNLDTMTKFLAIGLIFMIVITFKFALRDYAKFENSHINKRRFFGRKH